MNIINTVAPIPIDELKKYFVDPDTKFLINYKDSKLKDSKLLTYLSNLDIPADIDLNGSENQEFFDLLKAYFESPFLLNVDLLEESAIEVLLTRKNIIVKEEYSKFIDENTEIIDKWVNVLESLLLYNVSIINEPKIKETLSSFEIVPGQDLVGINFVNLIKHEHFYLFYDSVNNDHLKYYQGYFDDYMFKGKNLYSYWAHENNPLFLISFGIAEGIDIKDYIVDDTASTLQHNPS
jgi:hypothetical protein